MTELTKHLYRFGPFQLDVLSRRLFRGGEPVGLTPKAFDLLLLLIERRGRLLEKDELMRTLWPDTFVDEANLTQYIFTIRKILGEQPNGRPYIDTVARRGYLFVAEVEEIVEPPAAGPRSAPVRRSFPMAAQIAVALFLLAAVAAVGVLYLRSRQRNGLTAAAPGIRTLAVLPFRPLGRGTEDEYLALGMADALITRLAQVRGLTVRPTSSVRKYDQPTGDSLAAGRALKVESILDGRFQRSGNRIRVTVQLLKVSDGSTIWADHFDEPFRDVFTVQDAISERVADALEAKLTREERERLTRRYTENLEAYQLYLRGRYFWERRTAESLRKSLDYYQQAIAKDPTYALAYAGLADSYLILGNFSELPPVEAFPRAKAAAAKALEIDDRLAQADVAQAFATYLYDHDWETAERGFKRALAQAPNYGPGHQWYAVCLTSRGRFEDAKAEIQRAQEVDPLSLTINAVVAWIYYLARDYDAAIAAAKRAIEMDPNFPLSHLFLGYAYASQERYEEAIAEYRQNLALYGKYRGRDPGFLGLALARSGRTAEAREVLRSLQMEAGEKYLSPYAEALVRIGLGEKTEALTLLERVVDEHHPWVIHFNIEPSLDPLRDEPRFKTLLRRIGIPEIELKS